MEKQTIAVFDFDGTLTEKDTFAEFIKFTRSRINYYFGYVVCLPFIIAYKLKLVPNYIAKQKIFSYFFKGMKYDDFLTYGEKFSAEIDKFTRHDMVEKLYSHKNNGHKIYVISAGGKEWIEFWCLQHGVDKVIATLSQIDNNGCLTGKFASANCYGHEKVRRFLTEEPSRENYILYAYGDSEGDRPMIDFADFGKMV